jgi:hypothetical protein
MGVRTESLLRHTEVLRDGLSAWSARFDLTISPKRRGLSCGKGPLAARFICEG